MVYEGELRRARKGEMDIPMEKSVNDVRRDAGYPEAPSQGQIIELTEEAMNKVDKCHKATYVHEEKIRSVLLPEENVANDDPGRAMPVMSPLAQDLQRLIHGLDLLHLRISSMTDRVEL